MPPRMSGSNLVERGPDALIRPSSPLTANGTFCPRCGSERVGFFRLCRKCGFDFDEAAASAARTDGTRARMAPERAARPAATSDSATVSGWVSPATVQSRRTSRSIGRYAIIGAVSLLALGAISNLVNPPMDPGEVPESSAALIATPPLATRAPTIAPTFTPTPTALSSPASAPTPQPMLTPILVVDDGIYFVEADGRAAFRGTVGDYTYNSLLFVADRATVRWTATAAAKAACRVVWRIEPVSEPVIKSTVRVGAGDKESGNARYSTSFSDAAFLVDSTCTQWNMSIQGHESATTGGGNCDPSYPGVCIPPYPPDLDCGDISYRRFDVRGPDSHGFDGDNDGIGCESG